MRKKTYVTLLLLLAISLQLSAQRKVRIFGYVINENNRSIVDANVSLKGENKNISTSKNGFYEIETRNSDSIEIAFSHLNYETISYKIRPKKQVVQITVVLSPKTHQLDNVNVRAIRKQTSTMETIDPKKYRQTPNAGGNFESILIAFSGVNLNNELSSQYNVRGGSFDENMVYVNGTEIYRPLLIRTGQQEGLSFVNSDMVANVRFSSGGFAPEYGDKMSSVLDITYKKPTQTEASLALSLLGASAYLGSANGKFTQIHGFRYKTSQYLLGTLETQGEYKPNFIDYQTYLTYQLSPKWNINLLGNISQNSFVFIPQERETSFGTYNMGRKLKIYFAGQEKDLFQTVFGALSADYTPSPLTQLRFTLSSFHTNEGETYDITGQYILNELKMELDENEKEGETLGVGTYHEHARNYLQATVTQMAHRGEHKLNKHRIKWGAKIQQEVIKDHISEWEWRDSAGYSMPYDYDKVIKLYYNMKADSKISTFRTSAYLQDSYKWDTDNAYITLTGGVRMSHWTFNKELLLSPRVSLSVIPHWKSDFSFRFATGVYHQAPFYKEIRDTISDKLGNINIRLNDQIKAQRALHFVLGTDYFFRAWGRPFKFTTEAYLKTMDRVESYTIDNVRIRYSGENDAKAYTMGVDLKLYGELVPGADSWINFSLMQSKEDILNDSYKTADGTTIFPNWISRPNEQRYSFSMLFSDYLPYNTKYKMHLRAVYSDGLPIGPPRSERYKAVFRTPAYKRVDIGASRIIKSADSKFFNKSWLKHIENIWINIEILNLFDFENVNSYYWVTDINNQQNAVPNYLTKRQFNVKLTLDIE